MNVKLTAAQRRAVAILGGPGVAAAGGILHWGHGVSHRTARSLVRLDLAEFVYQRQQRGERATRTVWAIRRTAPDDCTSSTCLNHVGVDDDEDPRCAVRGFHDFELYDAEDGSVRNACRDCAEPADPEIITPAPRCTCGAVELESCLCNLTPREFYASKDGS